MVRLKLDDSSLNLQSSYMFQFLYGAIKTLNIFLLPIPFTPFQFLYGAIKTIY